MNNVMDRSLSDRQFGALQFVGEMLEGRFSELAARPHPDKFDLILRDLADAGRLVATMRAAALGEPSRAEGDAVEDGSGPGPSPQTSIDALRLRDSLPAIGEHLFDQFLELFERPNPAGAESLAANLSGAARALCCDSGRNLLEANSENASVGALAFSSCNRANECGASIASAPLGNQRGNK